MRRPARRRNPGSSAVEGAEPVESTRAEALADTRAEALADSRVETLADGAVPAEALVLPELVVGIESGARATDDTTKSFGVAGWTLFSRATGLLRVVVVGAILGPTFFANIFQATNWIPNIVWNLMAGSLLTELIIPLLVAELDKGGIEDARRLLRQIVGVVLAGFAAIALLIVLASPVIVHLLTAGVPSAARGNARTECWVLLFLVIPQVGLYGIVAAATAAQNSRGHFALAAAAPALENLGLMATLIFVSVWFGRDTTNVSNGYLVCLGVGATLAVALHAGVQCFGAARAGLPILPSFKWDHPAIGALIKRMIPAAGTASLDAGWIFILVVAAGRVPGGVVAIQIGVNFYSMPIALSAKAAGTVLLPRLSREAIQGKLVEFRETYDLGISWSWFVAIPAALTMVIMSKPIAQSIAFGEMRDRRGVALLSASIAGFGLTLLFATAYEFAKQTCYARHDVMAPLYACVAIVVVLLIGSPIAVHALDGAKLLFGLCVLVAIGEFARVFITDRAARRGTHGSRAVRMQALARHVGVAVITIGPGAILGRWIQDQIGAHAHVAAIIGLGVGVGVGLVGYLAIQTMLNAPEVPEKLRLRARRTPAGEGAA
jgi:putative peptidoglycan lipid II flippase